jgi:abhydrolase domain-containing protein 12
MSYKGWGTVRSFSRGDGGAVMWWEGLAGGHNELGWTEGIMDLAAQVAGL